MLLVNFGRRGYTGACLVLASAWLSEAESLSAARSPKEDGACLCRSSKVVGDCCCDFASVSKLNEEYILPTLQHLTEDTAFFRYFRVALCGQCHHRLPEPACGNPECSVCECSAEDLPCDTSGKCYLHSSADASPASAEECSKEWPDNSVDSSVDRTLGNNPTWTDASSDWMVDRTEALEFVDLHRNPERWTGYTQKTGADLVWEAIHNETSCFASAIADAECREHRVFSRLISGLHASISMHIASDFCVKPGGKWMPCAEFGTSMAEFRRRLYDYPERIENLYFAYLFTLRAMLKAAPLLSSYDYDAGDAAEMAMIKESITMLLKHRDVPCLGVTRSPFDETTVFAGGNGANLKDAFRTGFRNIASIMDCVGCSKCRLWGKLQVQGLGVALRILFANDAGSQLTLTRTEIIALVQTLFRFSTSLHYAARLSEQAAAEERSFPYSSLREEL